MLFVGCSFCRAIVPLWCAGQFMPHVPYPVVGTQAGAYCNMCGPLSPVFTCTLCWSRQMLFLPGVSAAPSFYPGFGSNFAPVVQAQPGTSQNVLYDLFKQAASGFASQVGREAATTIFRSWG